MRDVIFECSVSLEPNVNNTTVYLVSTFNELGFVFSAHFYISFVTLQFSFYFQSAFIFAYIATSNIIISTNPPTNPPVELFSRILNFGHLYNNFS